MIARAVFGVSLWFVAATFSLAQSTDLRNEDRAIAEITFTALDGSKSEIAQNNSSGLTVVAFLGTECPLAKQYGPRLQQLAEQFPQVRFVAFFSNEQDSVEDIRQYLKSHRIELTAVRDDQNRFADQFGATRTPEVFLLDGELRVRYRGRVDDQYGVGVTRNSPSETYLVDAIQDLTMGGAVRIPAVEPVGCLIGRVKQKATPAAITLSSDVAAILNRHCVQCHRPGAIGPFAMTDPQEIVGWSAMINEVVQQGRMPPWHASPAIGEFENARRMSEEEKAKIQQWCDSGAGIGDPAAIPAPPEFVTGWQLPAEPDLVLPVSPKPFPVPAVGEVEYKYFHSDYVFAKDTWVQAVQIVPGNSAVVHHVLAFIAGDREPQTIGLLEGIDGYLAGYVPGLTALPFPDGMAKKIPAGSHLIFQIHYTPIGSPQMDASKIGLILADPKTVTHEVVTTSALRRQLEIPPNDPSYQTTSYSHRNLADATVLGFMPHMHLRGKSFYYEIQSADGSVRPVLDVPIYDFNWQTSYRLRQPIRLKPGDRICCVAQFDNSTANPNNPDSSQTVRWGDQTREEMMIGYFDIAVPREGDAGKTSLDLRKHVGLVRAFDQFDKDHDGRIDSSEVSPRLSARFRQLDVNGDGEVTFAELADRWNQ